MSDTRNGDDQHENEQRQQPTNPTFEQAFEQAAALPEEERECFIQTLFESPDITESVKSLGQTVTALINGIGESVDQTKRAHEKYRRNIEERMPKTADVLQVIRTLAALSKIEKYMREEYASNKEKYDNADIRELIAAATELARADGVEIPQLFANAFEEIGHEQLSSRVPSKHVIPNNKLANALTDEIIDKGTYELIVGGKGKNTVITICDLTYEGDKVTLTGKQKFTEYDRNVYNAVTSLYIYGDETHKVTPAMVYRAMVNMSETETPSAQQIGAVTRSLDKMRFIRAHVNCTAELQRRGACVDGEQITSGIIDTYLLAADAVTVEAGGKQVKAYHIIKTPILYEYSRLVNQVITVPAALLDVRVEGQRVRNTEPRIAIKGYLLRRIEGMKGKNKLKNDNISLESYEKDGKHHAGIYELAGEESATRAEKQRIRNYAEDVLRYWINEEYIAGYELIRESGSARTVKAIKIIFK